MANNTHGLAHYWAGIYGNLGHLYSPSRTEKPVPWLPYALDNGAYAAFTQKHAWDEAKYLAHVERYAFLKLRPQWAIVPDVVADRDRTLANWDKWAPKLDRTYHLDLAVAVQDGMTPDDVRSLSPQPSIVFVGGSTDWKWATVAEWCAEFPRVHVGRVNTIKYLDICLSLGAESCDGTGWFRGRSAQLIELGTFLAKQADKSPLHVEWIVHHTRQKTTNQLAMPMGEI